MKDIRKSRKDSGLLAAESYRKSLRRSGGKGRDSLSKTDRTYSKNTIDENSLEYFQTTFRRDSIASS